MQLLQRKSDQSQTRLVDAWHPNFRNRERLPDTKVVRTFFFVNVTAITVVLGLVLLFLLQEASINDLVRKIASAQAQVASNQKGAADAAVLTRKFADEEKKVRELDVFLQQHLVLSQFMIHLGNALPANLVIDSFEVHESGVSLRGTAAGSNPVEASSRTSEYLESLQKDGYFKDIFAAKDMTIQDIQVDKASGRVTFGLLLGFKGETKK